MIYMVNSLTKSDLLDLIWSGLRVRKNKPQERNKDFSMPYNIRIVSTYPPRRCGIGTFSRDMANALKHFTGEIGYIRVAAIDNNKMSYDIPVDLVIDQYNPESWHKATADIAARARESGNPTIILLQHEYGLDPDKDGNEAKGDNFVTMAKTFSQQGLLTIVYLHTLLVNPDSHQKKILQNLADYSDGFIVTTEQAVDILESDTYKINRSKVKHIDHGIRIRTPSQSDRLTIKKEYGFENRILISTLGLRSPDKGIQYSIGAYARFLNESCTKDQKENIVYLIAGQCHPEFVKADAGRFYREYQATIEQSLKDSGLRWCEVKELGTGGFKDYNIVFYNAFLDENTLMKLYSATNIMVLPYLDMRQISSGILADTLGAGRVAIATKFTYAFELISPKMRGREGIIVDKHARGILVDPGEPSIEQIAQGMDYLVFDRDERLRMEKRAHERGHRMRWDNVAWELLQHVEFLQSKRQEAPSRGMQLTRKKASVFAEINIKLLVKRQS